MRHEIIIKCESKKEIECIQNGLDIYRREIVKQIRESGKPVADNLVKELEGTWRLLNKMIEDLDKDF